MDIEEVVEDMIAVTTVPIVEAEVMIDIDDHHRPITDVMTIGDAHGQDLTLHVSDIL